MDIVMQYQRLTDEYRSHRLVLEAWDRLNGAVAS